MAESPWKPQADIIKKFIRIGAQAIDTAAGDAGQSGLKREHEELRAVSKLLAEILERDLVAEMEK